MTTCLVCAMRACNLTVGRAVHRVRPLRGVAGKECSFHDLGRFGDAEVPCQCQGGCPFWRIWWWNDRGALPLPG
jgi:hypothetical protein